jgi:hypothetical protein
MPAASSLLATGVLSTRQVTSPPRAACAFWTDCHSQAWHCLNGIHFA